MSFRLAHLDGARVPRTVEKALSTGEEFNPGSLLIVDANGEWVECGADPAAVAAVSISGAGADTSGFNRLGSIEFPPGFVQAHAVAGLQTFSAEFVGTLPAAEGGSFGVVKDTDGDWKVDFEETTTLVVKLVNLGWTESPLNKNRVLVQFLPTVVQVV